MKLILKKYLEFLKLYRLIFFLTMIHLTELILTCLENQFKLFRYHLLLSMKTNDLIISLTSYNNYQSGLFRPKNRDENVLLESLIIRLGFCG